MMDYKKTILDNGLRVIVAPQKDNPAVTVLVLVETGSKYETKEINGISHFLEHMCFKGTKKRPTQIDIARELDSLGASYNAFTSFEVTGYYAKVGKEHFDKALDVVSDIYLHQVFDPSEIEKEKGPVIEEINMYEDNPMRKLPQSLINLLYGDQPAGWDIAGPKEAVKALKKEDLIKYKKEHYLADSTAVIVAGAVDEKDALEKIKKVFKDMPTGKKQDKKDVIEKQDEPKLSFEERDLDQTHIAFGVRTFSLFDKRRYAAEVLADILGGSMSSRLFQKVRSEMSAAYYAGARHNEFTDHGYLSAAAGVSNDKVLDVIKAIIGEFEKFKDEKVDNEELQKSKDHIIGRMMLGLETSDELADFYGEQEIFTKELLKPDEIAKRIKEVTSEDIQSVAKEIFVNEKLNLAIIGPKGDKEALKEALKIA